MHQLVYISTAHLGVTETDVRSILEMSRRNNNRDAISGLLVCDGIRFLQALEGDERAVEATFARIKTDARHRATVVLTRKDVSARQFGSWDMAFSGFAKALSDTSLSDLVDQLVAEVHDPNTRALFSGFARIDRSRAA